MGKTIIINLTQHQHEMIIIIISFAITSHEGKRHKTTCSLLPPPSLFSRNIFSDMMVCVKVGQSLFPELLLFLQNGSRMRMIQREERRGEKAENEQ